MFTEEGYRWFVEESASSDLQIRVAVLKVLAKRPPNDPRVLPFLERMLEDRTPVVVMLPYHFGEIRWLAVQALAAERRAAGLSPTLRIERLRRPLSTNHLCTLARRHGVDPDTIVESTDLYGKLAAMDVVPTDDIDI